MSNLSINVVAVVDNWFKRYFVGFLPITFIFRLLDIYVREGHAVLLSTALSIFDVLHNDLIRSKGKEEFMARLNSVVFKFKPDDLINRMKSYHIKKTFFPKFKNIKAKSVSQISEPDFQSYFRPKIVGKTSIIDNNQMELLYDFLPKKYKFFSNFTFFIFYLSFFLLQI